MSKILFTDLDGTLLNDKKTISDSLKKALINLLKSGNKLVLSSGRPYDSIAAVKEHLGLPDENVYISAYNGSYVVDCTTKEVLVEKRVAIEDILHISEEAGQMGLHCHTYTDTHIVSRSETPELQFYRQTIRLPLILSSDWENTLTKAPFKALAVHLHDHTKLVALIERLKNWADGKIMMVFSNPCYLEFLPADSGKGEALKAVCEHLSIPINHCMAAGDAENDLTMIEAAGTGIAMANAEPELKEAADFVTYHSNNEDGLLPFIISFFELS
ncbi:MAG: Cof-type HAD-IIB family hydrolase [Lachnospiraceae bacterium]|nr:Cof-type HAD-IIB family hydrolase [Lachnospiraceae bacterium]MDD3661066.1 Cof-type HAD-IIB family hydrolase [Lachnospiraceae bacterium]